MFLAARERQKASYQFMKKWTIRVVIGLVVLLVVGAIGVFVFMGSIVKTGFETVGPKITKVDMHLGSAKVSALSQSCQLTGLVIGNPEGFKTPSAIKVGDIKVGMKVSSLFSDIIQVNEINIQAPEITLEGSLAGSNLGKILDNLKAASGGDNKPAQKTEKGGGEKNIYIKDVVISGGKINVSVTGLGGRVISVPMPPLHLENIGTQEKGVSMAEASSQIMQSILTSASKASEAATADIGKGLKEAGNGTKEGAVKAVESVKGLFKK